MFMAPLMVPALFKVGVPTSSVLPVIRLLMLLLSVVVVVDDSVTAPSIPSVAVVAATSVLPVPAR